MDEENIEANFKNNLNLFFNINKKEIRNDSMGNLLTKNQHVNKLND